MVGTVGIVGVVTLGVVTGGVVDVGVVETGVEDVGVDEEGVVDVVVLLPVQPARATEATARTMRRVGSFMTRTRSRANPRDRIIVPLAWNDPRNAPFGGSSRRLPRPATLIRGGVVAPA
jgi:hypothetical protein